MMILSKRRLRFALSALAVAATVASAVWATQDRPGDTNRDGALNVNDVMRTLRLSVGIEQPTSEDMAVADVAPWVGWGMPLGDGKIRSEDALRTMKHLVGLISDEEFRGVTNATYVGAAACKACHSSSHADWMETGHAKAFTVLKEYPNGDMSGNALCQKCHTVGFGKGGFIDEATTPHLIGVQCESCHGPGSAHIMGGGDKTKILAFPNNVSSLVCGSCHNSAHNPQMSDWDKSLHGEIESHVAGYFRDDRNVQTCGPCHSGDYRLSLTLGKTPPSGPDVLYSQTCSTCHDPHKRTGNDPHPREGHDAQLRMTTFSTSVENPTLCGQCHVRRSDDTPEKTSRPPHHSPQFSFLLGEGGASDTPGLRMAHASVPGQCVHCHMVKKEAEGEGSTAMSGHQFKPNTAACSTCHANMGDVLKTGLQESIKASLAALKTRLDAWGNWEYSGNGGIQEQETVPTEIKQARHNYYYVISDGSYGIHNAAYARALIAYANKQLDALGVPK